MTHPAIKRISGLVLVLLLLAACGATAPTDSATNTAASPASVAGSTAASTRTVAHAIGTTEVPTQPQRVVVLDTGDLDSVLALAVTPVGAVTAFADGEFQAYLADRTTGIQKIGTIAEPNLEQIVALKPDLILSSKLRHESIYEQSSQIAPTVFTERVGVVWKDNFKLHAEALGKTTEARAIESTYDARIEALADRALDALSGGQRQRAWIAMTLAQNTAPLLLDEPTTFLDMAHQLEVQQLQHDLNRREGRTIVMVVHDLNHAARYADHLIAMAGGRIVRQGAPGDVVTPTMLRDVFGVEANVLTDPRTGVKLCIPYRVYEPTADELEPMGFALEAAGTGR